MLWKVNAEKAFRRIRFSEVHHSRRIKKKREKEDKKIKK